MHMFTPPMPSPADVSPDKTCQNKPVPFWQVLKANGEGDLVAVTGYGGGASMGLGDGTHHGQAHARATRLGAARRIRTIEAIEQSVQVALGQLVHGVRHDKLGGALAFAVRNGAQAQLNHAALARIARGVVQ